MPADIMVELGHGGSFHRTIVTIVPQALSLALADDARRVRMPKQAAPPCSTTSLPCPVFDNGIQKYTLPALPAGQKGADLPKSKKVGKKYPHKIGLAGQKRTCPPKSFLKVLTHMDLI